MEPMTFEEWLRSEGYKQIVEIKEDMIIDSKSEEEIEAELEKLQDEYDEYLEGLEEE